MPYILDKCNKDDYIYVYLKDKNVIAKYKKPIYGIMIATLKDGKDCIVVIEEELKNYNCEIVELGKDDKTNTL